MDDSLDTLGFFGESPAEKGEDGDETSPSERPDDSFYSDEVNIELLSQEQKINGYIYASLDSRQRKLLAKIDGTDYDVFLGMMDAITAGGLRRYMSESNGVFRVFPSDLQPGDFGRVLAMKRKVIYLTPNTVRTHLPRIVQMEADAVVPISPGVPKDQFMNFDWLIRCNGATVRVGYESYLRAFTIQKDADPQTVFGSVVTSLGLCVERGNPLTIKSTCTEFCEAASRISGEYDFEWVHLTMQQHLLLSLFYTRYAVKASEGKLYVTAKPDPTSELDFVMMACKQDPSSGADVNLSRALTLLRDRLTALKLEGDSYMQNPEGFIANVVSGIEVIAPRYAYGKGFKQLYDKYMSLRKLLVVAEMKTGQEEAMRKLVEQADKDMVALNLKPARILSRVDSLASRIGMNRRDSPVARDTMSATLTGLYTNGGMSSLNEQLHECLLIKMGSDREYVTTVVSGHNCRYLERELDSAEFYCSPSEKTGRSDFQFVAQTEGNVQDAQMVFDPSINATLTAFPKTTPEREKNGRNVDIALEFFSKDTRFSKIWIIVKNLCHKDGDAEKPGLNKKWFSFARVKCHSTGTPWDIWEIGKKLPSESVKKDYHLTKLLAFNVPLRRRFVLVMRMTLHLYSMQNGRGPLADVPWNWTKRQTFISLAPARAGEAQPMVGWEEFDDTSQVFDIGGPQETTTIFTDDEAFV